VDPDLDVVHREQRRGVRATEPEQRRQVTVVVGRPTGEEVGAPGDHLVGAATRDQLEDTLAGAGTRVGRSVHAVSLAG